MTKCQYPHLMRHWENAPAEASDGQWVSQPHAAEPLGVSTSRVGHLIANGHLSPATTTNGDMGVTRSPAGDPSTSTGVRLRWSRGGCRSGIAHRDSSSWNGGGRRSVAPAPEEELGARGRE